VFIHIDSKTTRTPVGRVAEFCAVCDALRAFQVVDVTSVTRLYFTPLGKPRLDDQELACESCKSLVPFEINRYAGLMPVSDAPVADLVAETNPNLYQEMADRLDRRRRAVKQTLTPGDRRLMLLEPFYAINPSVHARSAAIHVDALAVFAVVVATVLFSVAALTCVILINPGSNMLGVAIMGTMLPLMGMVYWVVRRDVQRFIVREHLDRLIAQLSPLNPSLEELADLLAALNARGYTVGKKVDPRWLHARVGAAARAK